jgi:hypothetical protein
MIAKTNNTRASSPLDWAKAWFSIFLFFAILAWARDVWLIKHTTFPYTGSGRRGDTPLRSDAYAYTATFLAAHKMDVVSTNVWYSDPPFWDRPCKSTEYGVRALAQVLDPATGSTSDVTMYFCYAGGSLVYPANQQAQFYTRPK